MICMPVKRKGSWKRKAAVGVVTVAVGATGFGVGRLHRNFKNKKIAEIRVLQANIVDAKIKVRDPLHWAKICRIYGWKPKTLEGRRMIGLVELVSRRTGKAPHQVLAIVSEHSLYKHEVDRRHESRLNDLRREVGNWQQKASFSKGDQRRWNERQLRAAQKKFKSTSREFAEISSVVDTFSAEFRRNPDLHTDLAKALKARGARQDIEAISRKVEHEKPLGTR